MFDSALSKTGVVLFTVWVHLSPAAAEEPAADMPWKDWPCKFCPDTTGTDGWVEPGIGYQSEDSYRFGRYTGLKDDGVFGNAGGYLKHREEDGRYFEIRGRNLGLDSRDVQMEGGQQGNYKLFLEYDQLPSFNDDTTSSPFRERNGSNLLLPQNWVPAASTQDMATLQQNLKDVTIKTERKRLKADFSYLPFRKWELTARFLHEKKDGRHDVGTTFGFSETSILPVPVEYRTNELGFGIGYTGRKLQAKIAYDGSFFDEDHNHRGLVWQNPYADPSDPNGFGQYALPPDNNYHKLSATLGYDLLSHTRMNAHLSIGRLKQDGNFLPYTINPDLVGGSLPTNDLDGQVNSTLARLGVSSRPLPRLRVNANYTYSDRDNDSSRNSYDYVVTDLFDSGTARRNKPYSFEQHLFRSSAAYRLSSRSDMSAGFDYDRMERTHQEVDDTEEKTLWGELRARPHDMVDASIKYTYANRSNSDYDRVAQITQNPRLRLYNLASRTRNKVGGALSITPASALTLGLSADYYKDDYDNTSLGLTEAKGFSYTADVSYFINENLTTTAYFTRERLQSDQAGSQSFSQPDWFMDDRNMTRTVGVGINWTAIPDRLDIGADLVYSDYSGKINYDNAADYPDLESTLKSARLHGTYKLKENIALKLAYRYEDFSEDDWARDGIGVATLPTVLGLGADTQDYDVHVIAASIRYDFE